MDLLADFRALDPVQRRTVGATFLGWALDAFDYFTLVMVLPAVARSFHVGIEAVAVALLLTLACRPVGAWIFGRLADRYGRQRILMLDVALYSVLGLACAFAPSLLVLLVLRALFGVAMGGEWGTGASLAIPPRRRHPKWTATRRCIGSLDGRAREPRSAAPYNGQSTDRRSAWLGCCPRSIRMGCWNTRWCSPTAP